VRYCVTQTISTERDHTVYLRVLRPLESCELRLVEAEGHVLHTKRLRYVFPAEMVTLKLRPAILQKFHGGTLRVDLVPRAFPDQGAVPSGPPWGPDKRTGGEP
jgi:hypothetical protein